MLVVLIALIIIIPLAAVCAWIYVLSAYYPISLAVYACVHVLRA